MYLKALKQLRYATKNTAQLCRVAASEVKSRLGIAVLRSIELQVTHFCNLQCDFCYAEDIMTAKKVRHNISLDQYQDILDQALPLGLIHINLTGGEPLLRKDIFEMVEMTPKSIVTTLVTNSSLLNRERIDKLAKAGLSTLQLSYGSNYKDFDIEMARYCRDQGISVSLSIVNVRAELENNKRALKTATDERFSLLFNYPMIFNNDGLDSEFYWKHRDNPIVREDNMFWAGKNKCPAGTHKIYISNDGDVMPCDRIHEIYGNIFAEKLKPIWQEMHRKFSQRPSYCLLETNIDKWKDNNRRIGIDYPVSSMGHGENPFNVLDQQGRIPEIRR